MDGKTVDIISPTSSIIHQCVYMNISEFAQYTLFIFNSTLRYLPKLSHTLQFLRIKFSFQYTQLSVVNFSSNYTFLPNLSYKIRLPSLTFTFLEVTLPRIKRLSTYFKIPDSSFTRPLSVTVVYLRPTLIRPVKSRTILEIGKITLEVKIFQ